MPRRRCDPSRMTSRTVHLVLFVCWVALVVWKVLTFISEPTTSETFIEDQFHRPYVTICRIFHLRPEVESYLSLRGLPESFNTSLLNVFKYGGYSLSDMMTIYNSNRADDYYASEDGNWMEKYNYAFGGRCSTLETAKNMLRFRLKIAESKNDTGEVNSRTKRIPDYILYFTKLSDFWGGIDEHFTTHSDSEMALFHILRRMSSDELVISTERDVMPNLSHQPCEEDPNYSRSTCWRDCFLDSLSCSLLEGNNTSGKPICTAADYRWFKNYYSDKVWDGLGIPCSCRRPCALDRYSISVRPSIFSTWGDDISLQLVFNPVRRTTRTYVTYDIIDLMADIGGFIGLLLGYSLYSVFDDLKAFVIRLFRRRAASAPVDAAPVDPAGELGGNVLTFSIRIDPTQGEGTPRNRNING